MLPLKITHIVTCEFHRLSLNNKNKVFSLSWFFNPHILLPLKITYIVSFTDYPSTTKIKFSPSHCHGSFFYACCIATTFSFSPSTLWAFIQGGPSCREFWLRLWPLPRELGFRYIIPSLRCIKLSIHWEGIRLPK